MDAESVMPLSVADAMDAKRDSIVAQVSAKVSNSPPAEGPEHGGKRHANPCTKASDHGAAASTAESPDTDSSCIDCPVCTGAMSQEYIDAKRAEIAAEKAKEEAPKSPVKPKRKEDKAIDHILRALSSLHTTEEKLAALCKKYADLLEEHRNVQNSQKQIQRKLTLAMREKDQLQTEYNKAVMAKSKLESLCRELQKHNKQIKEESLARARDDDERRREVHAKFQSTIGEIQTQMSDNHDNHMRLKQENFELSEKLKKLLEKYETQEQHVKKLMQQRELEGQLHDVKLQQAQMMLQEEKEYNKKEKELLILRTNEADKQTKLHEAQENQLRTQLEMYTEKYEEFQSTLNKSNEVFGKFKSEMDKMAKRIKKLEKETLMWRGKWESSQKSLIDMAEDRQKYDRERVVLKTKNEKLESLCRALQAERNEKRSASASGQQDITLDTPDSITPAKTPPNTPDMPSRSSPETVQGAAAHSLLNPHAAVSPGQPSAANHCVEPTITVTMDDDSCGAARVDNRSMYVGGKNVASSSSNLQLSEVVAALDNHLNITEHGTEAAGCSCEGMGSNVSGDGLHEGVES